MNRKRRQDEAGRAADIFSLALSYLGFSAMFEAFSLFSSMRSDASPGAVKSYTKSMRSLTVSQRSVARELGIAYYRLARALTVGETYASPGDKPGQVTLQDLRDDFTDVVERAVPKRRIKPTPEVVDIFNRARLNEKMPSLDSDDGDEKISTERFDWPEEITPEGAADSTEKRLGDLIDFAKAHERQSKRRGKDANKHAGVVHKNIVDGGREVIDLASRRDKKAIGFVRVSRTGDPCYFCAMQISRGVVFKSKKVERGGSFRSEGELYHDNCNCYSVAIYSMREYRTDPRFALNRELQDLWKTEISGRFTGKDAINEWRQVIRARRVRAKKEKRAA